MVDIGTAENKSTTVEAIDYIVKTPRVVGGRARIAGRRIPVWQIANVYVRLDGPIDEITDMYDLTPAQVHAALAYYYDHQAEIDAEIEEAYEIARTAVISDTQRELEARFARMRVESDREMTTAEVAETYGITAATVRQTILRGAVPARKSGRTWLIRASDAAAQWGD